VQLYDAKSKGAEAYTALAVELLRRNGIVSPKARKQASSAAGGVQKVPQFWPYNR
jgi:hypothetical protein